DFRHARRDLAGLGLLPEPLKLLKLLRVGGYKGCGEANISLRNALEATDRRKGAAVTNGGDGKLIEQCPVREPIDTLGEVVANPRGNIIAPSDDDIGAKRRNQLLVFLGSIGDDRQPFGFGE